MSKTKQSVCAPTNLVKRVGRIIEDAHHHHLEKDEEKIYFLENNKKIGSSYKS